MGNKDLAWFEIINSTDEDFHAEENDLQLNFYREDYDLIAEIILTLDNYETEEYWFITTLIIQTPNIPEIHQFGKELFEYIATYKGGNLNDFPTKEAAIKFFIDKYHYGPSNKSSKK